MHGCMALTYVKSPYAWDRSQFPNLVNSVPERVDWYHDSSSPDWWPSCMQLSFFLAFGKKTQISSCLIFNAVTREHNRWTYIYIGWLCRSLLFAWIYCFLYYAKRSSSHVRKTATREQNVRPIAQWRGKKNRCMRRRRRRIFTKLEKKRRNWWFLTEMYVCLPAFRP